MRGEFLASRTRLGSGLELVASRLAMTRIGVLLLLLSPADECDADGESNPVERMHESAAAAFPRAGTKQLKRVIHVSLIRLLRLTDEASSQASSAAVRHVADAGQVGSEAIAAGEGTSLSVLTD